MALGKPIIHFVNDVPDYTHWVLKKYPYAISILKDYAPIQVNIKIVQQFIEKNQNSQITFAETAKIFPEALPFNTAKVIQNLISP
jgi:tyrosine-protein phosphatase YwqE